MNKRKVKKGSWWKDKISGDTMRVAKRHHDGVWHCTFPRGRVAHKIDEITINKYYEPLEE